MERNIENLKPQSSFIPRRGMKLMEFEKGVVSTRDKIKQKIMSYPEASTLPEPTIDNIIKIAIEQNKLSDSKWFIKMLGDANKKYQQALEAKAKKEAKKLETPSVKNKDQEFIDKPKSKLNSHKESPSFETRYDSPTDLKKLSDKQKREPLFQKDELQHLLPHVPNLRSLYPNLKNVTWFYLLKNYGDWPLIVMAVFPDREKIFPSWTIQAAATLKEIGLKTILELELHKDADALYKYMKIGGKYKKCFFHRVMYLRFLESRVVDSKKEIADENE